MKKAGFTLMELMFACAILLIAIGGLLGTYVLCFNLNETAKNLTLATNAIQQKLEEIRDYQFEDIASHYDNTTFDITEFSNQNAKGSVVVYYETPDLLLVVVSVSWRQRGGRIIGEDNGRGGGIALNGYLDGGEDLNNNNTLDSPAIISVIMAKRGI